MLLSMPMPGLRRFLSDWTSHALWALTLVFAVGCMHLPALPNATTYAGTLLGLGTLGTAAKLLAPAPPSPWFDRLSTLWLLPMLGVVAAAARAVLAH